MDVKDAWVLRLKEEAKKLEGLEGIDYYFSNDEAFITTELNAAEVFYQKEAAIEEMKEHERQTSKKFGEDAICNYGYTNMMQNFDFVPVTVREVDWDE